MPSSHTLFLVSYSDGSIIIYDKEREDGTFTPQDPNMHSLLSIAPAKTDDSMTNIGNSTSLLTPSSRHPTLGEWDPTEEIFVSMPPWHPASPAAALGREGAGKSEKAGKNPISHWKLSRRGVVGKEI